MKKNIKIIIVVSVILIGIGATFLLKEQNSITFFAKTEKESIQPINQIASINGIIKNSQEAKLKLYNSNQLIIEKQIKSSGPFEIPINEPGEYDIVIEEPNKLSYKISKIKVKEKEKIILNPVILINGDMNNDGQLDILDLAKAQDEIDILQSIKSHYGAKNIVITLQNHGYNKI